MLNFKFELGFRDALGLAAQIYWGSALRALQNIGAMYGAWIFISLLQVNFDLDILDVARILIEGLFCAPLLVGLLSLLSAWRMSRSIRSFGAARMVGISDQGLQQSFGASTTQHAWAAITRIEESRRAFYFFLTQKAGVVLPKRAISSPGEMDMLRGILRHLLTNNG